MQRLSGSVMRIGRRIGLNDDKGYLVPVFIALIVVIAFVGGYYWVLNSKPEPFSTIFLLDSQHQAINYPQVLVAGQNSTFDVNVAVVNHMNNDESYQVRTKIVKNFMLNHNGVNATSVDTYDVALANGATNEHVVTVTENNVGSYAVVFELWIQKDGSYEFTQNYCVLNIDVTN